MSVAPTHGEPHSNPVDRRADAQCERLGVSEMKTAQPGLKHRRLNVRDKLLFALLPTVTVLPMLAVIEAFGRHHLLCASMAASAFLIYWDPRNEMNSVHAVVVSQMTAASVGWLMWLLLGGGYAAAAMCNSADDTADD